MIAFIKKLIRSNNDRGSILTSAFLTMVILSLSVAGIAQLTVNQFNVTSRKLETLDTDMLGEALLEQAVYEFENYLQNNNYDFAAYEAAMLDGNNETAYGILVEDVSGVNTGDLKGDFSDYDGETNIAYRFTYTYNEGNSRMVMYSYITNTVSYAEPVYPFDFQIATNGSFILNGGYLRNPQFFADTILFTNTSPYVNQNSGSWDKTPSTSAYPDFNGNGSQAIVYYRTGFYFCEVDCYDISGITSSDPYTVETDEYLNVETEPNSLETGTINPDKIIADFFGGFDLEGQIVDFVQDDGPTEDRTVATAMDKDTIGSTIWNNHSGDPEEECVTIKIKGKDTLVCYDGPSSEAYTRMNTFDGFDPANDPTDLDFGGIYQGNLTISEDFTITNMSDTVDTETLIIDGDLIIDNSGAIELMGFFVVLGDLYFQGDEVSVSGGFYVTGQTYVNFNDGEGFTNIGANNYSFALFTMDNVIVQSIYETHVKNGSEVSFNWFIYTDESIYADVVNNRMIVNGMFFAAAKGVSGNEIPVEDENGDPIRGIVINAFDGYVASNGTETLVNNFVTFDFDPMQEASLHDEFVELPEFEMLATVEGDYSIYRSDMFYYNN